jgi:hypothetical protein
MTKCERACNCYIRTMIALGFRIVNGRLIADMGMYCDACANLSVNFVGRPAKDTKLDMPKIDPLIQTLIDVAHTHTRTREV